MTSIQQSKLKLQSEAFHGLAGEIVEAIEPHSEADPAGLLAQLLLVFGNIIGRNAYFAVESSRHYANINVTLVGDTSNGRKGTSWNHIIGLFEPLDPEWKKHCLKSGLSSGEGLIWNVRDLIEEINVDDCTGHTTKKLVTAGIQDKRLTLAETEFASLLKVLSRDGNTLSPVIRNAWDTGDLSTLTKNQPAKSTGAHVSILGHVTKTELNRYLADTEAANGFGNRILWVFVQRSKILPRGGTPNALTLELARTQLRESIEYAKVAGELRRSAEADLLWDQIYPVLTEGRYGLLGAMTARAAPQVMRLALIYALIDKSPHIGEQHLRAAYALWKYSDKSCQIIFNDTLGDATADEIIRILRGSPSGLTRTDISNHFGRNKSATEIGKALELLSSQGQVQFAFERPSEGHGRSVERWYPAKKLESDELNEINEITRSEEVLENHLFV